MGFFDFFRKRKEISSSPAAKPSKSSSNRIGNLAELLAFPEPQRAIVAMDDFITEMALRDPTFASFTPGQKVFYAVEEFEREINNGGLDQYFSNTGGNHTMECIAALKTIGHVNAADLLVEATKAFPDGEVPTNRAERGEVMERIEEESEKAWEALDAKYYKEIVDLAPALMKYVQAHQSDF